jgi:integrase
MRAQGSIKERSPGVWQVRVYLGIDAAGKRTGFCKTVRGTKRDARALLAQSLKSKPAQGTPAVGPYRGTLGDWILEYVDKWCPKKSERTVRDLRYTLPHYTGRALQATKLADLTSGAIASWVNGLTHKDKLSPRTVAKAFAELRECLERAVRIEYLARNPTNHVETPQAAHVERVRLDAEQANAFLKAAESDPLRAFFTLALFTGARPSELLGLQWRDVVNNRLTIRRSIVKNNKGEMVVAGTKTRNTRTIPLGTVEREALEAHRRMVGDRVGLHAVNGEEAFIFASATGTVLELRNVTNRHFKPLLKRAGLPRIRLYDLRHTCLSLLAEAREDPEVIRQRAGHSNIMTTYGSYIHSREEGQVHATDTLNRLIGGVKA